MAQPTKNEIQALESWASLNVYLKKKPRITARVLSNMLEYECQHKRRTNILIRLNNKMYIKMRDEHLKLMLTTLRKS